MTPIQVIEDAEKKVRAAAETFGLAHHVKPNAVMAGHHLVNDLLGAVMLLNRQGKGEEAEKMLPICPNLKQRLLCGLPVIVANRPDAHVTAVLIGDIEVMKMPEA